MGGIEQFHVLDIWTFNKDMVSAFKSNQDSVAEMSMEYQQVREQWTGESN